MAAPGLQWLGQGGSCCTPTAPSTAPSAPSAAPPSAAEGARKAKQFVALHWKGATPPQPDAAPQAPQEKPAPAKDAFSRFLAQAGVEQRFTLSSMAFQDALSLERGPRARLLHPCSASRRPA